MIQCSEMPTPIMNRIRNQSAADCRYPAASRPAALRTIPHIIRLTASTRFSSQGTSGAATRVAPTPTEVLSPTIAALSPMRSSTTENRGVLSPSVMPTPVTLPNMAVSRRVAGAPPVSSWCSAPCRPGTEASFERPGTGQYRNGAGRTTLPAAPGVTNGGRLTLDVGANR